MSYVIPSLMTEKDGQYHENLSIMRRDLRRIKKELM